MQIETEAIVLRTTKYAESDLILNVFTQKFGKIGIYAKNARRLKSPLMSSSQIFAYSNMMIRGYNGKYNLSKAELIDNNYRISDDMDSLYLGYYYLQFVEKAGLEEETNIKLFNLLKSSLLSLQENSNYILQKIYFDMKIIEIFGYKPIIDRCTFCGKNIQIGNYMIISSGGRVCNSCMVGEESNNSLKLDTTSYLLMDFIQKGNLDKLLASKVSPIILKEVNKFLDQFIDYYFDNIGLTTRNFLNY